MKKGIKVILLCGYAGLMAGMAIGLVQINTQERDMKERLLLMEERVQLEEEYSFLKNEFVLLEQESREVTGSGEQIVQEVQQAEVQLASAKEQLETLQTQIDIAKDYQQKMKSILEAYADLYQLDMQVIVANYDVERFKAFEKEQNAVGKVSGALSNAILGSLFGGGVEESVQSNLSSIYGNRIDFNRDIVRWMQDSMYEVSAASSAFNGSYEQYQKMAETVEEGQWLTYNMLLKQAGEVWETELLETQKQQLLDAMAKYRFHLQVFYDLYSGILVDFSYMQEVENQLAVLDTLLAKYDPEGNLGYDADAKAELLKSIIKEYEYMVLNMKKGQVADPALLQIGAEATDRKYAHKALFNASGVKLYLYYQNQFSAYFDNKGCLLSIHFGEKDVYFYEGEVLTHTFESEETLQSVIDTVEEEYKCFEEKYELY